MKDAQFREKITSSGSPIKSLNRVLCIKQSADLYNDNTSRPSAPQPTIKDTHPKNILNIIPVYICPTSIDLPHYLLNHRPSLALPNTPDKCVIEILRVLSSATNLSMRLIRLIKLPKMDISERNYLVIICIRITLAAKKFFARLLGCQVGGLLTPNMPLTTDRLSW